MAAERPGHPPGTASPRTRLRALLIVITIVVALTAGWPLLNALVADELKVPAGTALRVGPSGPDSASVRVGPHWTMRPALSDPRQGLVLARGDVIVSISYLSLIRPSLVAGIWSGLRQILRISHPGITIGPPVAVTSGQGQAGRTASVTSVLSVGAVTVFVGPSRTYAIQMVVLGPRGASLVAAQATRQFITTLRFPAEPAAAGLRR
ncbi:MAG TPA: hypothetical protein VMB74_02050 [Streptosporangiaceae bacterium]|nr:hypothetical protein [Streptosporangiaceae bacterium]